MSDLALVPLTFAEASEFVDDWHRHLKRPAGHKFSVGVADRAVLVGVAVVSRPVARHMQDGWTLEVVRVATDGTRNAGSMLYAAAWQGTKAMGYRRLITMTEQGESGASLRAAGYRVVAERPPRAGWDSPSRPRAGAGRANVARKLWEAA